MEHIEIELHIQWYERTSFSLLKDRSQLVTHIGIISIICKASRSMSGLQDAIILSCTNW